jgi:ribosome-associated protein
LTRLPGWSRALECIGAALDRKAYDLVALEVGRLTTIADYFIICSGRSDTQVRAIAEHVVEQLEERGARRPGVEGLENGHWVLIDFGDVVVHVFHVPVREFYDLERLWSRAPRPDLPEPFQSQARSQKTGTENG